jgi:hypothetical protein
MLTALASLSAVATVALDITFSFAPTSLPSVWAALVTVALLTIVICVAAGEFGGRWGGVGGIISGVLIVPPIGIALAWWIHELFRVIVSPGL